MNTGLAFRKLTVTNDPKIHNRFRFCSSISPNITINQTTWIPQGTDHIHIDYVVSTELIQLLSTYTIITRGNQLPQLICETKLKQRVKATVS